MSLNLTISSIVTTIILFTVPLTSAAERLKSDNVHARTWNKFASDILVLHQKIAKTQNLTKKTGLGGYFGNPNFYKEEVYTNKAGELVSRIQWERKNPSNLHSIEVFLRDKKGRVIRDYAAAYLPDYRNAPTQTLISFYVYNDKLTAYRTFDASDDRIGERCEGTLKGKEVNFLLDEDEIVQAMNGFNDRMEQPDYIACFKGMPENAGKFLTPQ